MTDQLKILFAGCGDIAQRAAARTGHQSFGLRRNPQNLPAGIVPIAADITDSTGLASILDRAFDVVVVSLTPGAFTEQAYRDSYVKAAEALSQAIAQTENKPSLVIWVSSTSVYGNNNGDWVNEDSATAPQSFSGKTAIGGRTVDCRLTLRSLHSALFWHLWPRPHQNAQPDNGR